MQLIPEAFGLLSIVLALFLLAVLVQLFYYWFFFARLAFYRKKKVHSAGESVSVVIAAKNEYYNLRRNLPLILEQDYPDFEVIVVNDASDDDTAELLEELDERSSRLKVVNIYQDLNFFKGKKFPLSIGIRSAKHDVILLTDADCKPHGREWIKEMAGNFNKETEVVLGYGPYEKTKGLLNKIIRFDTLHIAVQYFSFALAGLPYMGVGRNLAYRKKLFLDQKGFTSHYKVSSGDDDLFINKVAHGHNTRIEIEEASHMPSRAKSSFVSWFRQKRRHLSTGQYYSPRFKFLLGLYAMSQLLFYFLFVLLISLSYAWIIVLAAFALRLITQLIVLKKSADRLNEKDLLLFSPLFELIIILLNIFNAIASFFVKQHKWK